MIRIGILHSLSGTMSQSEKPLVKAALMAVEEINNAGGVLGEKLEAKVMDGASNPETFALQAREMACLGINTIFGCWTSSSRKAVKDVIEETGTFLWYPVQYEGLEQSPNIFYFGSTLHQQIEPAVSWCLEHLGGRCFLIGSDYVFPRVANRLIRALVEHAGGEVAGEIYLPLGEDNLGAALEIIRKTKPDVVFNTINGDSNIGFFRQMSQQGLQFDEYPTMSFSVAENEIVDVAEEASGHYSCWGYFQSLESEDNLRFIEAYQAYCGSQVVTSDPIVTAYSQIHVWAKIANAAGSVDPEAVRNVAIGQSFESPLGLIRIGSNQHVSRWARIGRARKDGQFDIVWQSHRQLEPLPWLGLDESKLPSIDLIKDALAELPHMIDVANMMEKEVAARKEIEKELEAAVKHLEKLSFFDALTGIANRRLFNQLLSRECGRARRDQKPLSLIMIDIDLFKQYNDHYGHQQGDICLKKVAQALSTVAKRPTDLLARYGGEEFVLLLPNTDKEQATKLSDMCCKTVINLHIKHGASSISPFVSISAGFSTITPSGDNASALLLKTADEALYAAKRHGRNRFEFA
ncbi:MAG: transporter substrate-binding protein [Sedimenticola sp.]